MRIIIILNVKKVNLSLIKYQKGTAHIQRGGKLSKRYSKEDSWMF